MNLDRVTSGRALPNDFNVIIEIPMHGEPIKYEVDKETGAMFVDRFMSTSMRYPCNYGYIPHTIAGDGDPVDVLVLSPVPLMTGVVVRCRPVGMLRMTDEAGGDAKLLAVPIDKLTNLYRNIETPRDLHLRGISAAVPHVRWADAHHCLHHPQRRNPPHPEPHRGGVCPPAHHPGTRATSVGGLRRAGG